MKRTKDVKKVLSGALLAVVCGLSLASATRARTGRAGRALTDADIVRMVKSGQSDSAVIAAIHARRGDFDLSGEKFLALHKEGVSSAVLQAMFLSRRGRGTGPQGLGMPLGKMPLVPRKTIRMVTRPRAMNQDAAILAVLQKQRRAAQAEMAQTKLRMQRPGQGGPSKPMSTAPGAARSGLLARGAAPAAGYGGEKSSAAHPRTFLQPRTTLQKAPTQGAIGPERTQNATGNASAGGGLLPQSRNGAGMQNAPEGNGSPGTGASGGRGSRVSAMPALVEGTVLLCAKDPTFRILRVSGSYTPATFTPIDSYNLYTIEGCGFGNQAPTNSPRPTDWVHLYGPGTFNARFEIKFWSDNEIEVSLDPSFRGYLDQSNLTLVVKRADGRQAQKAGFKFYAARQSVLLRSIPPAWVKHPTMWNGPKALTAYYFSPASSYSGPSLSTATVYMSRIFKGAKFDPTGVYDSYDLSRLAPGWTADPQNPPQLILFAPDCQGAPWTVDWEKSFGMWTAQWDGNNVRVGLEVTSCSGVVVWAPWANYQNSTSSLYALRVWVRGPRGTDPITGRGTK